MRVRTVMLWGDFESTKDFIGLYAVGNGGGKGIPDATLSPARNGKGIT